MTQPWIHRLLPSSGNSSFPMGALHQEHCTSTLFYLSPQKWGGTKRNILWGRKTLQALQWVEQSWPTWLSTARDPSCVTSLSTPAVISRAAALGLCTVLLGQDSPWPALGIQVGAELVPAALCLAHCAHAPCLQDGAASRWKSQGSITAKWGSHEWWSASVRGGGFWEGIPL